MKNKSPFELFASLYNRYISYCQSKNIENYNTMYIATCSLQGEPTLRAVLLKEFNESGFIFYTNTKSVKGKQLLENPNAALLFHFNYNNSKAIQIRVEGKASLVSENKSNDYFATRPRMSKIGAYASLQSQVMQNSFSLLQRVSYFVMKFKTTKDKDIPRPLHWKGFILKPIKFEFWYEGAFRAHKRNQYSLQDGNWVKEILFP